MWRMVKRFAPDIFYIIACLIVAINGLAAFILSYRIEGNWRTTIQICATYAFVSNVMEILLVIAYAIVNTRDERIERAIKADKEKEGTNNAER